MNIRYDRETDTMTITLREARVMESAEVRPGMIFDLGYDGAVVSIEILDASNIIEKTQEIRFSAEA